MRGHAPAAWLHLAAAALLPWCAQGLRRRAIRVDIVAVAESLQPQWVEPVLRKMWDTRLRLYCTGDPPLDAPCRPIERVGSEEYAFLKHIVDNYHALADVTIFTPRDLPTSALKQRRLEDIVRRLDLPEKQKAFVGFESQNYFPLTGHWDGPAETCGPTVRPFGKWYARFVNATDLSLSRMQCTAAALGNVFAVTAERIRRNPLHLYQGLMREVEHCRGRSSQVIGYYIERSWAAMFAEQCHMSEARANFNAAPAARVQLREQPLWQARASLKASPAKQAQQREQILKPNTSIDLVVASYSAPLDWVQPQLDKLPGARLHLYCKGASKDPRCIHLDNVGTEEYAFLVHILRHYDNLADITVFTKDNMVETSYYHPTALDCLNNITNQLADTKVRNTFQGYMARLWYPVTENFDQFKYHASSSDGKVKLLCRPSISPFGPWYKRFINPDDTNYAHMHCTASSMHGIFAVSRDRVRRIPRARFVDLLSEVEYCRGQNAFAAGHYFERSWAPLFAERCHNQEAAATMKGTNQANLHRFWASFDNAAVA